MVAPTHFLSGLALNFGANFLGFLQLLVGSGSLHSALSNAGCAEKCTLFRSLEGVSFAAWSVNN